MKPEPEPFDLQKALRGLSLEEKRAGIERGKQLLEEGRTQLPGGPSSTDLPPDSQRREGIPDVVTGILSSPEATPLPPGVFLGKEGRPVTLVREVGAGVFARVFLATYSDNPDEQVAVKVNHYGQNLEHSNLTTGEREEAAKSSREADSELHSEARALQALTAFGSTHTPAVHYFKMGTNAENPGYITMDFAKGAIQTRMVLDQLASDNPQSLLKRMGQVLEAVELGPRAGFDYFENKDINWQTFWDEQTQHATVTDWGHARPTNIYGDDNFRTLLLHVASITAEWATRDPLIPVGDALRKLDDYIKREPINTAIGAENGKVTVSCTTTRATSSGEIYPLMVRLLNGEDPNTISEDIEGLRRTYSGEVSGDQPFDYTLLTELVSLPGIGDEYTMLDGFMATIIEPIKTSGPLVQEKIESLKEREITRDVENIWGDVRIIIRNLIKWQLDENPNSSLNYMFNKGLPSRIEHFVKGLGVEGLDKAGTFILSVLRNIQDEQGIPIKEGILEHFSEAEIRALFWDTILVSIRPDLATAGNRERLLEGLGKLAYLVDSSALDGIDEIRELAVVEDPAARERQERDAEVLKLEQLAARRGITPQEAFLLIHPERIEITSEDRNVFDQIAERLGNLDPAKDKMLFVVDPKFLIKSLPIPGTIQYIDVESLPGGDGHLKIKAGATVEKDGGIEQAKLEGTFLSAGEGLDIISDKPQIDLSPGLESSRADIEDKIENAEEYLTATANKTIQRINPGWRVRTYGGFHIMGDKIQIELERRTA